MNVLLSKLAGGELAGFILVLARVTPLFLVAPLFSSKIMPPQVRGIIAVGISIGLTPLALSGQRIPTNMLTLAALVLEGLLTGLAFAFSIAILFAALESAAAFVDAISGFSFGSLVDSMNGPQNGVISELYAVIGTAIFLAIGGDGWTLRGIARTFQLVPLTSGPRLTSLVGGAAQSVGRAIPERSWRGPAPGDLIVFGDEHVGIVRLVLPDGDIETIEGNCENKVALNVRAPSEPTGYVNMR